MSDEQKFGSCVFGGFRKDDVLRYIDELLSEHEFEIEELKEKYENQNEYMKVELEKKNDLNMRQKEKIISLENIVESYNKKDLENNKELSEKIKQKEDENEKLKEEIKNLKKQLQVFEHEEKEYENDVKRAEYIAKERVKQIIRKGKARAENEYSERIEKWKKEKEDLEKVAYEEASKILNSAAARVYNFNTKVKEEVEGFVNSAKKEAGDIIEAAKYIADKILKESAKIALKQSKNFNITEFKIHEQFDVKDLNKKIDEEVLDALQKLKCLKILETNKKSIDVKENIFKRHRKNPFEGFRRKS